MTQDIQTTEQLGIHFGHQLYSFELDYLISHECEKSAKDVLWRQIRMGLFLSLEETVPLETHVNEAIIIPGWAR